MSDLSSPDAGSPLCRLWSRAQTRNRSDSPRRAAGPGGFQPYRGGATARAPSQIRRCCRRRRPDCPGSGRQTAAVPTGADTTRHDETSQVWGGSGSRTRAIDFAQHRWRRGGRSGRTGAQSETRRPQSPSSGRAVSPPSTNGRPADSRRRRDHFGRNPRVGSRRLGARSRRHGRVRDVDGGRV